MRKTVEPAPEKQSIELTPAEFIALAERDREAALKLMWPDGEDSSAMRLLDAVAFDGFISAMKEKLQAESGPGATP